MTNDRFLTKTTKWHKGHKDDSDHILLPCGKMEKEQEKTERWTAKRGTALVVEILRGDTSAQEAVRQHELTVAEIEQRSRLTSFALLL